MNLDPTIEAMNAAVWAGRKAFRLGQPCSTNPLGDAETNIFAWAWKLGWREGAYLAVQRMLAGRRSA